MWLLLSIIWYVAQSCSASEVLWKCKKKLLNLMPKSVNNILKFIKYLWWSLCCNYAAVFWELIPLHPSLCCVHTILRQPKPGAPPRFIINRGPWGKHQKFMIPNRGIWHIRHVEFIIRCDDIHALHIIFVTLSDFFLPFL